MRDRRPAKGFPNLGLMMCASRLSPRAPAPGRWIVTAHFCEALHNGPDTLGGMIPGRGPFQIPSRRLQSQRPARRWFVRAMSVVVTWSPLPPEGGRQRERWTRERLGNPHHHPPSPAPAIGKQSGGRSLPERVVVPRVRRVFHVTTGPWTTS
jgi:hypothetical protein